jgi:hypothetical protein
MPSTWHNSGDWSKVNHDDFATVLEQLAYALYEREKIAGRGLSTDNWTPWYVAGGGSAPFTKLLKADATEKIAPSAADFYGTVISNPDLLGENITRLRNGIERCIRTISGDMLTPLIVAPYVSNYTAWFQKSDRTHFADIGALLSLGSYGSSWVTATYPNDNAIYLQLREAFDNLRYMWWEPYIGNPDGSGLAGYSGTADERYGGDGFDGEAAWDNCVADTPASRPWNRLDLLGEHVTGYDAWIRDNLSCELNTQFVLGSVTEAKLAIYKLNEGGIAGAGVEDFSGTIDGTSLTATGGEHGAWVLQNFTPSAGSNYTVTGTIDSTPADWPADAGYGFWSYLQLVVGPGEFGDQHSQTAYQRTHVATDINSLLTYHS